MSTNWNFRKVVTVDITWNHFNGLTVYSDVEIIDSTGDIEFILWSHKTILFDIRCSLFKLAYSQIRIVEITERYSESILKIYLCTENPVIFSSNCDRFLIFHLFKLSTYHTVSTAMAYWPKRKLSKWNQFPPSA